MSQTIHARFVEAQVEQANEHDKKQGDIGDEGGNHVEFRAVEVTYYAGGHQRHPRSAKLGMG